MKYVITSSRRKGYLTGFYPNGGWNIGDVFAFSTKNYIFFSEEKETQEYIIDMKEICLQQTNRWGQWLNKALIFWKTISYKEVTTP